MKGDRARIWIRTVVALSLLLASGLLLRFVEQVATARAIAEVDRRTHASAILLASGFRRELDKFQLVPVVLADDAEVRAALRTRDPVGLAALNRKLEVLSAQTRAANVYLLDLSGINHATA